MIVKTEKMVAGGYCLAILDGRTLFVEHALPYETVAVQITKEKNAIAFATVVRVIEASEQRIEPKCRHYGECGGCNLQIASYEYQAHLKKEIVIESLKRSGITDFPEIHVIQDEAWGYRCRFQLHNGGIRGKKSDEIIDVRDCPVARPEFAELFAKELSVSYGKVNRFHAFGYEGKLKIENATAPEVSEENTMTISVLGKNISFDVRGFFQSNIGMLEKSIPLLCEGLNADSVLDFYSGVGTFSMFLSEVAKEVFMVEHNKHAVRFAERNLAGKKHTSFAIDAKTWLRQSESKKNFDAIIIDPPRSGIDFIIRKWIVDTQQREIRYISCDPTTFSRDAAYFIENNYTLTNLYLLDFYPQTSHIECFGIFKLY